MDGVPCGAKIDKGVGLDQMFHGAVGGKSVESTVEAEGAKQN